MGDLFGTFETQVGAAQHQQRRDRPGATLDSASPAGSRYSSLLRSDPLVMRQMMGSSRLGSNPRTYLGVTAASSITAPAALLAGLGGLPDHIVHACRRHLGNRRDIIHQRNQSAHCPPSLFGCRAR